MKKKFNVTGTCYPDLHYMMDFSAKLNGAMKLVEGGDYFVINRPRQYGKTTTLYFLAKKLRQSKDYLPIQLNFQGIDRKWYETDAAFAEMFSREMINAIKFIAPDLAHAALKMEAVKDLNALSHFITKVTHESSKKLVLLIDEVDASSNYYAFLSFLSMLRTKFLERRMPQHATFHSIVLVGVHDIKSLKYKLRNPEEVQYNSPWNIATDFKIEMSFNPNEIAPMLEEYCDAENVKMDIPVIAERLYYHTSGYPFLVSRLCKIIAEELISEDNRNWNLDDIEKSVQILLKEDNPNFVSIIKSLKNNEDLYNLVFRLIINGDEITFNHYNTAIEKGVIYGIFQSNGKLKIHNRIFEQQIYNYLITDLEVKLDSIKYNGPHQFLLPNNELNIEKVFLKFQQFIKEQYSNKDQNFLEREWRLLFLAFMQPILNGGGYAFKETQISQEKRLDIVITYHQHRYIIELKKWYGPAYHEKGLDQLAEYLDIHGLEKGFLLIFDTKREISNKVETITRQGKEIFIAWI